MWEERTCIAVRTNERSSLTRYDEKGVWLLCWYRFGVTGTVGTGCVFKILSGLCCVHCKMLIRIHCVPFDRRHVLVHVNRIKCPLTIWLQFVRLPHCSVEMSNYVFETFYPFHALCLKSQNPPQTNCLGLGRPPLARELTQIQYCISTYTSTSQHRSIHC
jgi:hypothetical protein